jgi:hypothetical protein
MKEINIEMTSREGFSRGLFIAGLALTLGSKLTYCFCSLSISACPFIYTNCTPEFKLKQ